ncbi:hypothetical protein [Granulicella arctica]|uniref:hypothetical protein n=1 Tax=Granulicella arctica TaxID=940613 RepID=UPI0021DFE595|nr:hypothetical protein [Granulicella arctica]
MQELIQDISLDAIWLQSRDGYTLLFALAPLETMPAAVQVGDTVEVVSHPRHPVVTAMESEEGTYYGGYYDLVHTKSGLTIRTVHHRP